MVIELQLKIKDWIKENRARGARLLQKLVQENSTRENESKAQAIIIEKCRRLGMSLDIWEIGDEELLHHPSYHCDRKDFKGNPNVVGVLRGAGGGKSIILNGHVDVVPVGDYEQWSQDPFSGHIEAGKLYGRGSTDMKGGTVALLMAIEALTALDIKLKGDIIFQSVIEEESGGAGTLAAVLRGYKADGAIIPEPTNMKIFPIQQGSMWFRITVKGRSAHGGTRYEGVSAIEKAMLVIEKLRVLERRRNNAINDPLFDKIPIPINIGKFSSGEWPSSVPDIAIIEGRMGVSPDETMAAAEKELENELKFLEVEDTWFIDNPLQIEWFGGRWLPGSVERDHPLLKVLEESYVIVKQEEPLLEASPWGTDGGILSRVGKTPVIVFGPGVTSTAHETDEYIILEDLFEASEIIALTIARWCEVASD
ncbi:MULTISPECIES: peptidase [unclassified Bacillus (in: firmicutes)]|uniref:peptidase n=1 Tax=unclassified Bacillus (in: firmicutes) TaxID=185979 RepID=UPI0008E888EE|nr:MULTISPECIES: peptidase [unclassified Bacillus (in: firmicutes)]SFA92129.1 4-acetamidobutyryl-CoA deacetylase [Bacillus sp. UNCCL13]SFQ85805.1 4-acetamidobutyryl-CoA deacetylase [Bacillus sp. cl95]